MRTAALLTLSLATLATAAPSWNEGDNHKPSKGKDNKKNGKVTSKSYVSSQALIEQIYQSDLEEGAYVLQGISDRFNG
jgi:hypothetical protein